MADISGDMQIIVSDDVVKEALQHYFDSHELPLYIADASIQSVGFMLSVDFKWKQQSRQPKSMADLKQMFKAKVPYDAIPITKPEQPEYTIHFPDNDPAFMLSQQIAQGQVSQEKMNSIYDMLAQLEHQE